MTDVCWAEITSLEHGHGGVGWELGQWLWSPAADAQGADRYAVMRDVKVGDIVFHMVAGTKPADPRIRVLFGKSVVDGRCEEVVSEPANAGAWAGRSSYYRIKVRDFVEFSPKPLMDSIEETLFEQLLFEVSSQRPKYYPYARYGAGIRTRQGLYLARLSSTLADAFEAIAFEVSNGADSVRSVGAEFAEGERYRREQTLFRRSAPLRRAVRIKYGTACVVCGFDFGKTFGELGEGFIEVHHLNPFGEREAILGTCAVSVDELRPLCPNCHRMAHRRSPSLSIEELRNLRGQSP